MDEIFGRKNFITNVIWRKNYSPKSTAKHFSEDHDHILVYAQNADIWTPVPMPRTEKQDKAYRNIDNDPRGAWKPGDLSARNYYSHGKYKIETPSGRIIEGPPGGNYWRMKEEKFWEQVADNRIWWGKNGDAIPQIKRFLNDVKKGITPQTIWNYDDVGHTQEAKKEILHLFSQDVFITPKPERLMQRIIQISSNPGDIVLDSFLGSGTTAAVSHKLKRRHIGIETGDHAVSHCVPRLRKVIEGEQGGISGLVDWKGGGGFRFFRLGPPVFDEVGRIRSDITFPLLAAHVWFAETGTPWLGSKGPFLGVHDGRAYVLLYNGVLGDKRPDGGNVLSREILRLVRRTIAEQEQGHSGPMTVYAEQALLSLSSLESEGITFKQTPYDVRARR